MRLIQPDAMSPVILENVRSTSRNGFIDWLLTTRSGGAVRLLLCSSFVLACSLLREEEQPSTHDQRNAATKDVY